jgi:sodium/potassium/calcium exchanger 6
MRHAIRALSLLGVLACVAGFLVMVELLRGDAGFSSVPRVSSNGTVVCDVWQLPRADMCANIDTTCPSGSILNYTKALFCSSMNRALLGILITLELVLLFFLLGAAADQFRVPSLGIISETLRIPDDIAGITLMALANGAPDVFGTFVAVTQNAYGISVGELLGAGLFVTTVVVGGVALVSVAKVQQFSFLRDTGFYVLGLIIFVEMLLDGFVSLLDALVMLVFYLGYVAFASIMALRQLRRKAAEQAQELIVAEDDLEVELDAVPSAEEEEPSDEFAEQLPPHPLLLPESRFRPVAMFRRKWDKKSASRRALWLALAAVRLPLSISCPDLRPSKWDSLWVAGTFLFSPFVLVFASGFLLSSLGGALPVWAATLVVAVALCVASLFLLRGPAPPQDWRLLPLAFWAFLLSIAWIYLLAHELVGILQALGMLMRISDVILGATVLAWGASVGDTVSNILVAKKGSPETAIAAAFGGPLFNLLFGSSVSLLYMTVKLYPAQYAAPLHLDSLVTAVFLVGNIAVCAGVVHWQKYTIPRWFAFWLFSVYLAYDVVLVLFGAGIVNNPFIN